MAELSDQEIYDLMHPKLSDNPHRIVDRVLTHEEVLNFMPNTSRDLVIRTATAVSCVVFMVKVGLYTNSLDCEKCDSSMVIMKSDAVDGLEWFCKGSQSCRKNVST